MTKAQQSSLPNHPFEGGEAYFIRTVTYHLVGRVKHVLRDYLILEEASWVADSGRFMQAIMDGTLSEVEPVGTAYVSLGSITDAFPWGHDLPARQK
jgi:hypothetical protein